MPYRYRKQRTAPISPNYLFLKPSVRRYFVANQGVKFCTGYVLLLESTLMIGYKKTAHNCFQTFLSSFYQDCYLLILNHPTNQFVL